MVRVEFLLVWYVSERQNIHAYADEKFEQGRKSGTDTRGTSGTEPERRSLTPEISSRASPSTR